MYQDVQEAWAFGDLHRYHHKAGKEKLIEQLDAAGYWGPKVKRKFPVFLSVPGSHGSSSGGGTGTGEAAGAPTGKKAKAAGGGRGAIPPEAQGKMPPPSGTNLVALRAAVAGVKEETLLRDLIL